MITFERLLGAPSSAWIYRSLDKRPLYFIFADRLSHKQPPDQVPFEETWNTYKGFHVFADAALPLDANVAYQIVQEFDRVSNDGANRGLLWYCVAKEPHFVALISLKDLHDTNYKRAYTNVDRNKFILPAYLQVPYAGTNSQAALVRYSPEKGKALERLTIQGQAVPLTLGPEGHKVDLPVPVDINVTDPEPGSLEIHEWKISPEEFFKLEVTVRYFRRQGGNSKEPVQYSSLLINPDPEEDLTLEGTLDPLRIDFDRCFVLMKSKKPLRSFSLTTAGRPIGLTPQEGGKIVFARYEVYQNDFVINRYYPSLNGDFVVNVEGEAGDDGKEVRQLLCGSSSLEYVTFAQGDVFSFHADSPALIGDDKNIKRTKQLSAETAWLEVRCADGAYRGLYCLQPDSAPLYADSDPESFYSHLTVGPNVKDKIFPFFPIAGAGADQGQYMIVEQESIYPLRRKILTSVTPSLNALQVITAATPQGFVQELAGPDLQRIILAKFGDSVELSVSPGTDVDSKRNFAVFADTIKNKELFLVVTDYKKLGSLHSLMNLSEWNFNLLAAPTIIVFKFSRRELSDLVGSLELWTRPDFFTNNIGAAQTRLSEALKELPPQTLEASWSGILILDASVEIPNGLPKGARGLANGFKKDEVIKARYLAVEISRVQAEGSTISNDRSSVMGLLEYKNEIDPTVDNPFLINYLKAKFKDSVMEKFECHSKLRIVELFLQKDPNYPYGQIITIEGTHESHGAEKVYTFRAKFDLTFTIGAILESVSLLEVRLTAIYEGANLGSRFSLDGSLNFKQLPVDLFSFTVLKFRDLRFELFRGGPIKFIADRLVFDLEHSYPRTDSLFNRIPIQLRSLIGSVKLPDLNFFSVGGDEIDFGLLFDLDLGSLGGLVSLKKSLVGQFLFGWKNKINWAWGFRFPELSGGRKEFGIEGIVKILVEHFNFLNVGNKTALRMCVALEVLGMRFPPDSWIDLCLFAGARLEKLQWFMNYKPEKPKFAVSQLALGQHIEEKTWDQCDEVFTDLPSQGDYCTEGSTYDLSRVNPAPTRDWLIFAQFSVWNDIIKIAAGFNDPDSYVLCLSVKDFIPDFMISYKKITDEVGVFALDFKIPGVDTINVGAAAITLPHIGIQIFSNGGFLFDLGFPWNKNFSRSFRLQLGIYIGAGGFYVARLVGNTSTLLTDVPKDARILQLGVGGLIGIHRGVDIGPMHAGLTVAFYGILEGAVAYYQGNDNLLEPNRYCVVGQFGVIGELYGIVDFGVVKATVGVRILLGIGVRFETDKDVLLWIEGRVTAYAELRIEIDAWLETIVIVIGFTFETTIRYEWVIPNSSRMKSLSGVRSTVPLFSWNDLVQRLPNSTVEDLPLYFIPEIAIAFLDAGKEVHTLAMLSIEASKEAGVMKSFELLATCLGSAIINSAAGGSDKITFKLLSKLNKNAWPNVDYQTIVSFLTENFKVTVSKKPPEEPDQESVQILFPMIPEMLLATSSHGTIDFSTKNVRKPEYLEVLTRYFKETYFDPSDAQKHTGKEQSIATTIFIDYFQYLSKATIDRIWQNAAARGVKEEDELIIADLLKNLDFCGVSNMLARTFRSGLRLPEDVASITIKGLYELTGQEVEIDTADFSMRLEAPPGAWFSVSADIEYKVEDEKIKELLRQEVTPEILKVHPLPNLRFEKKVFPLSDSFWTSRESKIVRFYPFGESLIAALCEHSLKLEPRVIRNDVRKDATKPVPASDFNWGTMLEFHISKIPDPKDPTKALPFTYQLIGADETNRRILTELLDYITTHPNYVVTVAYLDPDSAKRKIVVIEKNWSLLKTNLSTEGNPFPTVSSLIETENRQVFSAELSTDPGGFLQLVHECSIVNSGGYYLNNVKDTLPDEIFSNYGKARLFLIIEHKSKESVEPFSLQHYANALVLTNTDLVSQSGALDLNVVLQLQTNEKTQAVPAMAQGWVGFCVERKPPAFSPAMNFMVNASYGCLEFGITKESTDFEPFGRKLALSPMKECAAENGMQTNIDDLWKYMTSVPLYRFAKTDKKDPYNVVGKDAAFDFNLVDWYGHAFPNPLSQTCKFTSLPYFDDLVSVSAWNGVRVTYELASTNSIKLKFHYEKQKDEKSYLELYEKIVFQLEASDVQVELITPLDRENKHIIDRDLLLKNFVRPIRDYLSDKVGKPPEDFESEISDIRPANEQIVKVLFVVGVRRTNHVDKRNPAAELVQTTIYPVEVSSEFVDRFEATFVDEHSAPVFALAWGRKQSGTKLTASETQTGNPAAEQQLYAIRRDLLKITPSVMPFYYALPPLYNQLWSGTMGQTHYADVDIDACAQHFLELVESLLSPSTAAKAYQLSHLHFNVLMSCKGRLANAIVKKIMPVINRIGPSPEQVALAQTTLRQRLLLTLRNVYEVDAVVQIPMKLTESRKDVTSNLYGKVNEDSAHPKEGISISSGKVSLSEADGKSYLNFTFGRELKEQESESLNLAYGPTHLEDDLENTTGSDYLPAKWYSFIKSRPPASFSVKIPVALRRFPPAPRLLTHSASLQPITDFDSLFRWKYVYEYEAKPAPQDTIHHYIYINRSSETAGISALDVNALAGSLVEFRENYPKFDESILETAGSLESFAIAVENVTKAAEDYLTGFTSTAMDLEDVREYLVKESTGNPIEIEVCPAGEYKVFQLEPKDAIGEVQHVPCDCEGLIGDLIKYTPDSTSSGYRRRQILLPLDMRAEENASSRLRLVRNEKLPDSFHYQVDIQFVDPVSVTRDHDKTIRLEDIKPKAKTLEEYLKELMDGVLGSSIADKVLSIECKYCFNPNPLFKDYIQRKPIFFASPELADEGQKASIVQSLTERIRDWFEKVQMLDKDFHSGAYLQFAVTVFGRCEIKPIIVLRDIQLQLSNISGWFNPKPKKRGAKTRVARTLRSK